ncbi:GDP-fucose protein O-fucosyltransferase 2-like [Ruditapes philippinarum]|uniref:GDP-fucose protein O-fucosyltransferase 2-like n=1 Tax=Ruditapes philippinarum TaxID=129788 RepID=UPI00295B5975|nr:GDP-fucose protein O-fucosyltransferase 2-like [Ruditapes philippinarum]XP_060590230.1 GDP-fucose protein O-fucosyltransferase 2-like [Ruditapes philippinarum]XP_060590231.1 GDP-fucose protein O-fucosyltransferase 2-like [Ruditapes philippinarum]
MMSSGTFDSLSMFVVVILILVCSVSTHNEENLYQAKDNLPTMGPAKSVRYLLYDVNPGEGFNLRRDVYMRVANLVKFLNEDEPWVLVLPPWGKLYHWQSTHLSSQTKIKWENFFDINSLAMHVPVIEFEDYLKAVGKPEIDEVYYLQRYKEGWTKWEEKIDIRECIDPPRYRKDDDGKWRGQFFGYEEVYAKKFECMSSQAYLLTYKPFLMKNTTGRTIFLDRAENVIHGQYSEWSREWWTARRSMVFAKYLRDVGDEFRKEKLDSNDIDDKTELEPWTKMKRNHGDAKGGPYVAIHLRRKDYLYSHAKEVPSLENAAKTAKNFLKKYNLKKLFLATDANGDDLKAFKKMMKGYEVYYHKRSLPDVNKYYDGAFAIIDQWICAHARVFIGSHVSTFSFRIHEEREILGFDQETTFNRFCGDDEPKDCEQPTKWKIMY